MNSARVDVNSCYLSEAVPVIRHHGEGPLGPPTDFIVGSQRVDRLGGLQMLPVVSNALLKRTKVAGYSNHA
jgi:hypothetical protein